MVMEIKCQSEHFLGYIVIQPEQELKKNVLPFLNLLTTMCLQSKKVMQEIILAVTKQIICQGLPSLLALVQATEITRFKNISLGCQSNIIATKRSSVFVLSAYGCTNHLVTQLAACSKASMNCIVDYDFMRYQVHQTVILKTREELVLKYWNNLMHKAL